ncbi:hypothetical protein PybrP1_010484 [[Pythium] brassicae (nom. inval.)]|nr:hypothetical protein PybrP1_010484 [[Pythium] brassicae (nom. inval.)]
MAIPAGMAAPTVQAREQSPLHHKRGGAKSAQSWDPNKARKVQRAELLHLREQAAELERRLSALQTAKNAGQQQLLGASGGSDWQHVAASERTARARAEAENAQMKVVLENQLQIAKGLEVALQAAASTQVRGGGWGRRALCAAALRVRYDELSVAHTVHRRGGGGVCVGCCELHKVGPGRAPAAANGVPHSVRHAARAARGPLRPLRRRRQVVRQGGRGLCGAAGDLSDRAPAVRRACDQRHRVALPHGLQAARAAPRVQRGVACGREPSVVPFPSPCRL